MALPLPSPNIRAATPTDRYWLVEPMKSQANEFINRPLDVKYLLDELERRDKSDPFNSTCNKLG